MSFYAIRIALLLILPMLGNAVNVCTDFETIATNDWLHVSVSPKGGLQAGKYLREPHAQSLADCLKACCELETKCDTMFFSNGECYLILCNTSDPTACDPMPRKGDKFKDTYLINVRQYSNNGTEITNSSSDTTPVTTARQEPLSLPARTRPPDQPSYDSDPDRDELQKLLGNLRSDCDTDTYEGCGVNEVCNFVVRETVMGAVCECRRGYSRESPTQECVDDALLAPLDTTTRARPLSQSCTFGLVEECELHELCVPRNSRSRAGRCECVEGYARDAETGWCRLQTAKTELTGSTVTDNKNATKTGTTASSITTLGSSSKRVSSNLTSTTQTSTTTTTTSPPKVEPLMVSAGGDKKITLPVNSITLSAYALPAPEEDGDYKYEWSLISHPEGDQVGQMDDINTASLKLSKLIAGLYTFKVTVSAEGKYGEALVNVTVSKAERTNKPPVAVISPKSQSVNEPNDVVFDGSMSTDDDKIVAYHWEQVSGPLNSKKTEATADYDRPMLVIKGLGPGIYTFKLTVTDSDGADNSTSANVTVIKEMDYPPKANAGSNVILSLPQNSVTLYGNASTDDKGIASYEWMKQSDDKLTADMTGTRSPFLHLENLEIGDYAFTLKVTDTAGQTSHADVHVFVKPEHNKPPIARAGKSKIVWLPMSSITLDGRNSTDDTKIAKYAWTQISGPSTIVINNADRAVATASKLVIGEYKFRLLVVDEEDLQSADDITITVKQNENLPPKANAGGDKIVVLPVSVVMLDGSQSSDDKRIVSYHWTRDDKSLAAGDILNSSDQTAVLQLINVVAGRYVFSLEVSDAEGLTATDSASIIVREDEKSDDLVELHLEADLGSFTEANKKSLANQLALLLHKTNQEGTPQVVITHLDDMASSGELSVTFYVHTVLKEKKVVQRGTEVVSVLKKKLRTDADVIDFRVTLLDTLVCQNNCSGHGHCDSHTKRCVCEAFWMENPVTIYLYGESNCDWSVLYVIIVAFIVLVGLAGVIWGIICLCRRCYKWRPKKRHRYTLLDEFEEQKEGAEMLPRGKIQNSSLMISESDFTSDEETLFINHKKTNGHVKNGLIKPKNKVKT